jgi:hypothetical protein
VVKVRELAARLAECCERYGDFDVVVPEQREGQLSVRELNLLICEEREGLLHLGCEVPAYRRELSTYDFNASIEYLQKKLL